MLFEEFQVSPTQKIIIPSGTTEYIWDITKDPVLAKHKYINYIHIVNYSSKDLIIEGDGRFLVSVPGNYTMEVSEPLEGWKNLIIKTRDGTATDDDIYIKIRRTVFIENVLIELLKRLQSFRLF